MGGLAVSIASAGWTVWAYHLDRRTRLRVEATLFRRRDHRYSVGVRVTNLSRHKVPIQAVAMYRGEAPDGEARVKDLETSF